MSIFSETNISPEKGADVLYALGVDVDDLTNIPVYRRVKEILEFFRDRENPSKEIRRVMKHGVDSIEHIWTYAQIQNDLKAHIKRIREFEDNFSEEIAKNIYDDYINDGITGKMEKEIKEMENTEKAGELKELVGEFKSLKKEIEAYG